MSALLIAFTVVQETAAVGQKPLQHELGMSISHEILTTKNQPNLKTFEIYVPQVRLLQIVRYDLMAGASK